MQEAIILKTREEWLEDELKECQEYRIEAKRKQRMRNVKVRQEMEERKYYCQQKIFGLFMLVLSIILLLLTCDGFMLLGCMMGIFIMTTKHMVLVNNYWFTHGGENQEWMY